MIHICIDRCVYIIHRYTSSTASSFCESNKLCKQGDITFLYYTTCVYYTIIQLLYYCTYLYVLDYTVLCCILVMYWLMFSFISTIFPMLPSYQSTPPPSSGYGAVRTRVPPHASLPYARPGNVVVEQY